jgi:hypothetical protein
VHASYGSAGQPRPSTARREDVGLDHSVHRPRAERRGNSVRGRFGGFGKPIGGSGLDLVAKRGALAITDRWIPARRRHTAPRQGFRRDVDEPGALQLGDDSPPVVIAVRRSRQKARRIVAEHIRDRSGDEIGEFIVFDTVPDIEDEVAARFEDAPRFAVGLRFVRKRTSPRTDRPPHRMIGRGTAASAHRLFAS